MRRFPAVLLLLAVAASWSGGLRYAHEMAHASTTPVDAAEHADERHGHAHGHGHSHEHGPAHAPLHDESHCLIHALLKLPMLGPGHVPALVLIGTFVACLTCLPARVMCRRPALLLDSRGPPALWPVSPC